MKSILILLCVVALSLQGQAQLSSDNPLATRSDSLVHHAVTEFFKSPCRVGLSLAIFENGKQIFYNYGSISRQKQQLPTTTSLYEIASLTKTFTGILLVRAVIEGKIKLDDDIRLYLTEPYPNLEYKGKPITFRHLSTHQSGLPNGIPDNSALFVKPDFDSLPFSLIRLENGYDRERYLKELHAIKLDTIPGSVFFKYSNIGIKLVGFILENIYKSSYADLVKRYITGPLQMNSTSISLTPKDSSRLVKGYNPNGNLMPYSLENAGAAGGLKSTTADMIRYVAWHLDEKDPIIKQSHGILEGDLKTYARGMNWNMALTGDGDRKIWQSGGSFGMSSQLLLFPDSHTGFILLANEGCFDTQGELEKIALAIFTALKKRGIK
jgi:serine-type D-Ala-D-Ala carboxypeptidase/endopeptidase